MVSVALVWKLPHELSPANKASRARAVREFVGEEMKMEAPAKTTLLDTSLTRKALSKQIVDSLQDAVINGVYKPGDWLVERKIAELFKVSSVPVREALQELCSRGLLTKYHHRGCMVTKLTDDEIRQLVELRAALEPKVIEWAGANLNEQVTVELARRLDLLFKAADANSLPEFFSHDLELHRILWRLSGNKYAAATLETTIVPLFATGQMVQNYRKMPDLKHEANRHLLLIDYLRAGQTSKASEILQDTAAEFRRHLFHDRATT